MANRVFEISDSIASSVSVSELSEMKSCLLNKTNLTNKTNCTHKRFFNPLQQKPKMRKSLIILFLIFIPACLYFLLNKWLRSYDIINIPFPPHYIHPTTDQKDYQLIQLSNQIKFALVSNTNCPISSLIIMISYGTSHDPVDYPGLSHLALKVKMTMKLGEFVKNNNMRIKHFNMSYHIDEEISRMAYEIDSQFFWESVAFLSESLNSYNKEINETLIDESLEGIQRQYEGLKGSDYYRQMMIINDLIYEKDNFIGNNDTLLKDGVITPELKDELHKGINKYYVGNNIKIVIEAGDGIKIIRNKVNDIFYKIPSELYTEKEMMIKTEASNDTTPTDKTKINSNVLQLNNLGKIIWTQAHINMKNLKLLFIIPDSSKESFIYYEYMSYLLNKREQNSLFMKLTKLSFIWNFESKISRALHTHLQFELNFNLTIKGIKTVATIASKAYAHIRNMTNHPIDLKRFHEFASIKNNSLLFEEEHQWERIKRLMFLLRNGLCYNDYLTFPKSAFILDEAMHIKVREYLSPENSIIFLETESIYLADFNMFPIINNTFLYKESYFESFFHIITLHKEDFDKINSYTNEPINSEWSPNPFITKITEPIPFDTNSNNNQVEMNEMEPEKIIENSHNIIWHRLDRSFRLPIVIATINVVSPYLRTKNESDYFMHVYFFNSLRKQLYIKLYPSIEAGNTMHIKLSDNGFTITINAFSDVIWKIIDIIVEEYHHPFIDGDVFEDTKVEFQYLRYFTLAQRARTYFRKRVKYQITMIDKKFEMPFSIVDSLNYIKDNSIITTMLYGNIYKEDIKKKVLSDYAHLFKHDSAFIMNNIAYDSPGKVFDILHHHHHYNGYYIHMNNNKDKYELNHFMNNYFCIGNKTETLVAEAQILLEIINDKARAFLLFGNRKASGLSKIDNMLYYSFLVEHPTFNPDLIDKHFDLVIDTLPADIKRMSNERFDAYKNKVAFEMRLNYDSLFVKARMVWKEIYRNTLSFKVKTVANFIMNYTKEDLLNFYDKVFINENTLSKISIRIFKRKDEIQSIQTSSYRLNPLISSIIFFSDTL